jgi:hypothetical protein
MSIHFNSVKAQRTAAEEAAFNLMTDVMDEYGVASQEALIMVEYYIDHALKATDEACMAEAQYMDAISEPVLTQADVQEIINEEPRTPMCCGDEMYPIGCDLYRCRVCGDKDVA